LFSSLAAIRLDLAVDWRTVAFTGTLALILGVVLGFTPALQAVRTNVVGVLQGDVTTGRSWRGRAGAFRRLLVGGQIALSVLLLVSAGLFGRSVWDVSTMNLGLRGGDGLSGSLRGPANPDSLCAEAV